MPAASPNWEVLDLRGDSRVQSSDHSLRNGWERPLRGTKLHLGGDEGLWSLGHQKDLVLSGLSC